MRWKDGERDVAVIARRRRDGGIGLELPGGALEARVQRRDDGRLAIRLGGDTFTATVVRRPTADGVDYAVFADGAQPDACGWSIRSTSRSTKPWPRARER